MNSAICPILMTRELAITSRIDLISRELFMADVNLASKGYISTFLVYWTYSLVLQIMMASPFVSKPVLPALPLICLYLAASIMLIAMNGVLRITALAGRLIPVLSVDVATRHNKTPYL
jgi:hypothetical protein